jgi:hypothetical protein
MLKEFCGDAGPLRRSRDIGVTYKSDQKIRVGAWSNDHYRIDKA